MGVESAAGAGTVILLAVALISAVSSVHGQGTDQSDSKLLLHSPCLATFRLQCCNPSRKDANFSEVCVFGPNLALYCKLRVPNKMSSTVLCMLWHFSQQCRLKSRLFKDLETRGFSGGESVLAVCTELVKNIPEDPENVKQIETVYVPCKGIDLVSLQ
jgi:hypothetical protein